MKKCLSGLKRYIAGDTEGFVLLNANESNEGLSISIEKTLNRYPDNNCKLLKKALAAYNAVLENNIVVGNGSSEMIDLLMKAYIEPGDMVLGFDPSFVMYQKYTQIYGGTYVGVKTTQGMMDVDQMIEKARALKPKLIFVCNPNNPTGSIMSKTDVEKLLKATDALVVVDEAYGEYADVSMMNRLGYFDNLIILKTFSKAFGMAAIRLGYLVAIDEVVDLIDTVRPPYNVSSINQILGVEGLKRSNEMKERVKQAIEEREKLYKILINFGYKVVKSYSNFLFVETNVALDESLRSRGILIRGFSNGTFRITVGSKEENKFLIEQLIDISRTEVVYENIV